MKKLMPICLLIFLFAITNNVFAQQSSSEIDLFKGAVQEDGLPSGWITAVDNYNCTIKFQGGAIYFERMSPDEKCSFGFTKNIDNGDYLLKTRFEIDGNEPGIFFDGKPLEKQHKIKVTNGVVNVGIQTRGAGKVWGNIFSMTLSKVPNPSVLPSETVTNATSTSKPDTATVDAVWEALRVFEGDYKTVTKDFDCQGMSIGVAQWNVGKSFPSVKIIIMANSLTKINEIMPEYGNALVKAVNEGKETTLIFVRSLQNIRQPNSCEANVRKANWNAKGKEFVAELGKLLVTDESIKTQRELRYNIFLSGWHNAKKWAAAYRGENAKPSMKEIAYFVDMQIFNGGGLDKFGIKYEKLASDKITSLSKDAINYLEKANDSFLLHKIAARKNAKLLKIDSLNESEATLFINTYNISQQLNAKYSKQFRLTVINRRAAILFGQAYYSDKDERPTKIELP